MDLFKTAYNRSSICLPSNQTDVQSLPVADYCPYYPNDTLLLPTSLSPYSPEPYYLSTCITSNPVQQDTPTFAPVGYPTISPAPTYSPTRRESPLIEVMVSFDIYNVLIPSSLLSSQTIITNEEREQLISPRNLFPSLICVDVLSMTKQACQCAEALSSTININPTTLSSSHSPMTTNFQNYYNLHALFMILARALFCFVQSLIEYDHITPRISLQIQLHHLRPC